MSRFLPPILIFLTFLAASMVNIYPLTFVVAPYRPMMLMIVLLFWAIYQPKYVGLGTAFLVGLLSDLLLDTHLGHQALCAVAAVFTVQVLTIYAKKPSLSSSWILLVAALLVYRVLLWILQSSGQAGFGLTGFLSLLTSLLIFPLIWQVLFAIQQRIQKHTY